MKRSHNQQDPLSREQFWRWFLLLLTLAGAISALVVLLPASLLNNLADATTIVFTAWGLLGRGSP